MERPRCVHCRNPIKEHQAVVGDGDNRFHQDCWNSARPTVIAAQADQQRDYERRIANEGLAALLSPYVKVFPAQRSGTGEPLGEAADEPTGEAADADHRELAL